MYRLLLVGLSACGLLAFDRGLPAWAAEGEQSIKSLARDLQPSIVTILTDSRDGEELSVGTGFVVEAEGLIATNLHVVPEGRRFTVQLHDGTELRPQEIVASDHTHDLALIRVEEPGQDLKPLPLAEPDTIEQGSEVVAFGNPLGLTGSVVHGIVSAIRDVDGQEMIQLAIPVQPGNSGGPLIDREGRVHGIVNMKSAVDDNLGFAVPVARLISLRENPNPVVIDQWVRLGRVDAARWQILGGGDWKERSGILAVARPGEGFGGRTLCLSTAEMPEKPFEIAVQVKLDDEAGAAGLVWHSDGKDRHYGFYPSGGNLRLSCFRGANVFSWQVLDEKSSPHYQPGDWNRLKVRVEEDRTLCFVNGQQVFETSSAQLTHGRIGLAKFRDTEAQFRRFRYGADLETPQLADPQLAALLDAVDDPEPLLNVDEELLENWLEHSDAALSELTGHASRLRQQARRAERLGDELQLRKTLARLQGILADETPDQLPRAALLIAQLDHPDLDPEVYLDRLQRMADEIEETLNDDMNDMERRQALDRFLFKQSGFHGGRVEYYHPANSHLNRVIEDREGLPITLSIVYMELARRLGIEVEGVGLPGHFVVRHVPEKGDSQLIDVFDRGTTLSRKAAERLVVRFSGRPAIPEDFAADTKREILTRVVHNLIGAARRQADEEALRRYTEALVVLEPKSTQYRMMRVIILHQTDRDRAALRDIDWLLEHDSATLNRPELQQMREFLLERIDENGSF